MPKLYEHLHLDITPRALDYIRDAVETTSRVKECAIFSCLPESVRTEVQNFISECRARLQHVAIGEGDNIPGRSNTGDWL